MTTQLFPALDKATEAALKASIERFGVLMPVIRNQHGQILDGHHRVRLAGELGVTFPVEVVTTEDDWADREIARTLNADRRHLSVEQRRENVFALREAGHSQRAIAGALRVSKKTIQDDLTSQVDTGIHLPNRVQGKDGKSYAATMPRDGKLSVPAAVERIKAEQPPVQAKAEPFQVDTTRQKQLAEAAKTRMERAVGTCNGLARGLKELAPERAVAVATPEEVDGWQEAFSDAISALVSLRKRLKEVGTP